MTPQNLGVCFGPNLIVSDRPDSVNALNDSIVVVNILDTMITNYFDIFDNAESVGNCLCDDEDIAAVTLPPLDVLCLGRSVADGIRPVRHRLVCRPPAGARNRHPQGAWRYVPTNPLVACQALLPLCHSSLHGGLACHVGTDAGMAGAVRLSGGVDTRLVCLAVCGCDGRCPAYGLLASGSVRTGQSGGSDEK